ncbi:phage virion morphogenesis protein [Chryseobacterium indologenes]|uniref:phage virion morphogenesis protein n=1 Tax=Chryseobacterium TaxID=59732 RepID=UPI001623F22E|nr:MULTISPECIES: phage virion morphogenesis protein [Chryseobacterium]MDM1557072.1 phage virion morphogenesis protein [Chryseobacterium indologenes]
MDISQFTSLLNKKSKELKNYTMTQFPSKAGKIAMRFVNNNFREQGYRGTTFKAWKPNKRGSTILIKTGKLRAATYYTTQPGQITIKNPMKYAKIHNEGFKGKIKVKAHSRNKYKKTRVGNQTMTMKSGQGKVKAHDRNVNIPRRQFIPTEDSPSPTLYKNILRAAAKDIDKIMNK